MYMLTAELTAELTVCCPLLLTDVPRVSTMTQDTICELVPVEEVVLATEILPCKIDRSSLTPRVCPAFSDLDENVMFRTSDDVMFRVEDFYLKANR